MLRFVLGQPSGGARSGTAMLTNGLVFTAVFTWGFKATLKNKRS